MPCEIIEKVVLKTEHAQRLQKDFAILLSNQSGTDKK